MAKRDEDRLTKHKEDKVWESFLLDSLANKITDYYPTHKVDVHSDSIVCQCIVHEGDNTPSMHITPSRRRAKCFGCGWTTTDPILLYSKIIKKDKSTAITEISNDYGLKLLRKDAQEKLEKQEMAFYILDLFNTLVTTALQVCMTASDEEKAEVKAKYNIIADDPFDFAKFAIDYIRNTRNVNYVDDVLPIGIYPTDKLIPYFLERAGIVIDQEKVEHLHAFMHQYKDMSLVGQLVFTYKHNFDRIAYFKIRIIKNVLDENIEVVVTDEGATPTNTAPRNKKFISLKHPDLKYYSEEPSFFGLDYYRDEFDNADHLFLVEGDFDEASVVYNQLMCNQSKDIFLCIGGGASGLDFNSIIENFGIRKVFLLFDDPVAKGDDLAYNVIKNNQGDMQFFVFRWEDGLVPGSKDADSVVQQSLSGDDDYSAFTKIYDILIDPDSYYNEQDFVVKRIREGLDRDLESGMSVSIKAKANYALGELRQIKDSILGKTLVAPLAKEIGISEDVLNELYCPSADSEDVFIKRLTQQFLETYAPVGIEPNAKNSEAELILWHKEKKRECRMNCAHLREAMTMMAGDVGSLYNWVRAKVGIPDFIMMAGTPDNPIKRKMHMIEGELCSYMGQVIKQTMLDLQHLRADDKKQGGVFYLARPGIGETERDWYLHNGNYLFLGSYNNAGDLRFKRVYEPIVNGHYFNITRSCKEDEMSNQWSKYAISEENLNSNELMDFNELLDALDLYMATCFNFKHKSDIMTTSALAVYCPIYDIFNHNLFVGITGDTHTGKSKLGAGTFGGKESNELFLVEAITNVSHYTEAGVRQSSHNRNLPVSLDEFEDKGDDPEKSRCVQSILGTIRTAHTGTKVTKGTPGGKAIQFTINSPIITIGIRPMSDPVDANRFVYITMEQKSGFQDPSIRLRKIFTDEQITRMRNSLSVVPFRVAREIVQYRDEIKKELSKGVNTYKNIQYRTLSQIFALAAVRAYRARSIDVGLEYIHKYVDEHASELQATTNNTLTKMLWEQLFRTTVFDLGGISESRTLKTKYTLNGILQEEDLRTQLIDRMYEGIKLYVTPEEDITQRKFYIIVSWQEARRIFPHNTEFKGYTATKLKGIADRNPNVLTELQVRRIIKNWKYTLRGNLDFSKFSVIEVTDIVKAGDIGHGVLNPPDVKEREPYGSV